MQSIFYMSVTGHILQHHFCRLQGSNIEYLNKHPMEGKMLLTRAHITSFLL